MSIGIPGIGIGLTRGGSLDADAAAWAAAVVANSGTYSAATLAAMSTFVKSAKASGYWTKLNRINLFCGDQLAAALVPLKVGGGDATDTNVNFVSGDYSEATGLTGNGTTKYLKTGLLGSALSANDTHMSLYNRASAAATGGIVMGAWDAASPTQALSLFAPFSDGNYYSDEYNTGTGRVSAAAAATPYGHIVGTRTAAAAHSIYRNGASVSSNATSGGSLPALDLYVLAFNKAGTANFGGTAPVSGGYSIGSGLSAADVTAYTAHMEAFQDALGRGVA